MAKNYWLKPIGLPEKWIGNESFSDFTEQIHFPNHAGSVHIGDWIFLHAVGHQKLVGLFEVTTPIFEFSLEEKNEPGFAWRKEFEFYLYADKKFKLFSNHWNRIGLNPNLLDNEFTAQKLGNVTPTNDSIDAIQHGKSHIRLTETFAKYLLQRMMSFDLKI